jgi:hypothetical protein
MFVKNNILRTEDSEKENEFTDRLKSLSTIERNAALALVIGLSPPMLHVETPENLARLWSTLYKKKAEEDLKALQSYLTIDIPFILNAAEGVFTTKNSSQLRGLLGAVSIYSCLDDCQEYSRQIKLVEIARMIMMDSILRSDVFSVANCCSSNVILDKMIYEAVSKFFDEHTDELASDYRDVIKIIKINLNGLSLYNISSRNYLYCIEPDEIINSTFTGEIKDDNLNDLRIFLASSFHTFFRMVYPAKFVETFYDNVYDGKENCLIDRYPTFAFPLYYMWSINDTTDGLVKEEENTIENYVADNITVESLERQFHSTMSELDNNLFIFNQLEKINKKAASKKNYSFTMEDRKFIQSIDARLMTTYKEEDYKEILSKLLSLISGNVGKILAVLAAMLIAVLGYWLLRNKTVEEKEVSVKKQTEKVTKLEEQVKKAYKKANKPIPETVGLEDYPELVTRRKTLTASYAKVMHHNIFERKGGYTPESIGLNITTIEHLLADITNVLNKKDGICNDIENIFTAYNKVDYPNVVLDIHNSIVNIQGKFFQHDLISLGYSLHITKGRLHGTDHFDPKLFQVIKFEPDPKDDIAVVAKKFWEYNPSPDVPKISSISNLTLWANKDHKGDSHDVIAGLSTLSTIEEKVITNLQTKASDLNTLATTMETKSKTFSSNVENHPYASYEVWPVIGGLNDGLINPSGIHSSTQAHHVARSSSVWLKVFGHFKDSISTLQKLTSDINVLYTEYTGMKNGYIAYTDLSNKLRAQSCKRAMELLNGEKK